MKRLFEIGDKIKHPIFGRGVVDHLNMSGPVVEFEDYKELMCCPESALKHGKD